MERVGKILLFSRSSFRALVHRLSAIDSPARLMTASAPSMVSAHRPTEVPSHHSVVTRASVLAIIGEEILVGAGSGFRERMTIWCFAAESFGIRNPPMKPV